MNVGERVAPAPWATPSNVMHSPNFQRGPPAPQQIQGSALTSNGPHQTTLQPALQAPLVATSSNLYGPPADDESDLSSDDERPSKPSLSAVPGIQPADDGEETETANEEEDSVTRCVW